MILSGGKGIRGPQNTGLLVGRADLIRAAAANGSPNSAVGRPCKVSKEAIIGLVAAIELFLQDDHDARVGAPPRRGAPHPRRRPRHPGRATRASKRTATVWTAPTVLLVDRPRGGRRDARRGHEARSGQGDPPIMVRVHRGELLVDPHCLRGDEASLVARRLREELSRRAVRLPDIPRRPAASSRVAARCSRPPSSGAFPARRGSGTSSSTGRPAAWPRPTRIASSTPAIDAALRLQERAGIEEITDGEWRRESYVKVFAERVGGFRPDLNPSGGLPYPAVVAPIEYHREIAAPEVRYARARTGSPPEGHPARALHHRAPDVASRPLPARVPDARGS